MHAEIIDRVTRGLRTHLMLILLGGFLVLDVLSTALIIERSAVPDTMSEEEVTLGGETGAPPRLFDIRRPQIDAEAAAVEVRESASALPLRLWVFLLIAYATLLVFNLIFDFERSTRVQWGFEALLTALTLAAWFGWDEAGREVWFPLAVLETGLLIYAVYLYLFDRKMFRRSLEEECIFVEDQSPTPL